jgi:hypothetical protein
MSVEIFLVHLYFGKVDVHVLVQVPVLLGNGVRIVGVSEGNSKGKGSLVGALSDVIPKILSALEHDLLIVVQLVASSTWTGLKDRAGIVVPLKAGVRLIPVHSPAKVTRVDVASKSLLVAVKLIANEVHLASKGGMVTLGAKVMGIGWHVRPNLGSIVISTDLHGKLATDQTHT